MSIAKGNSNKLNQKKLILKLVTPKSSNSKKVTQPSSVWSAKANNTRTLLRGA